MDLKELSSSANIYRNLPPEILTKMAVERGEGVISAMGALTIETGEYTGRSPQDKFIVDTPEVHSDVDWGNVNQPISEENFSRLEEKMKKSLSEKKELFVFDGFAGADKECRLPVRVITNTASRSLFIRNLLIRPADAELASFNPELVIMADTTCESDPDTDGTNSKAFAVLNFTKKVILLGRTEYCGEIKKSVFSFLNYTLPKKGIFPMHCSANMGNDGDTALFFGLSGTGKTTLSTDESRQLIGDDEHGWSERGIFNFEGGSYAKCINLNPEFEPLIYNSIKEGAVVENVVMNPATKEYDFTDESLTENTRVGFPLYFIPGAREDGIGGHPKTVIFLTADAFGVLPPVSKLDVNAAVYHFMSGYTSKLAGTERGITEPQATFSAFFGAPFMPHKAHVYGDLLKKYISTYGSSVFLINTGWSGGAYGVGKRISIKDTRAIVNAALNGELNNAEYRRDEIFNLEVPVSCPGVEAKVLVPRETWDDKTAYDEQAKKLAEMFNKNFAKFAKIDEAVKMAGPKA